MEVLFQAVVTGIALTVLGYTVSVLRLAFHPDLRKIPGPFVSRFTTWPLKIEVLRGHRTKYIHELHRQYGPYVRIAPSEISTSSIEAHRQIHRISTEFIKAPWYQGQTPTQIDDNTCGVFGLRNQKVASARRRLFQQAGTKAAVVQWEPVVVGLVKAVIGKIKRDASQGTADVAKWFSLLTSDVLSSLAFGEPFRMVENETKSQLIHDIESGMIFIGVRQELPWLWYLIMYLPIPSIGRPNDIFKRFDVYGETAVKNTKAAKPGSAKTLFSKMVPEDGTQKIPDSIVRHETANIIIAGSDTTAIALTYLVYSVLKHPNIHQKLAAELETCSEDPSWEELESKPYINNVITETLRLHAPVPSSLPRVASEGTFLGGQYAIPGFAVVDTQAYTFHRDPRVFPNPEQFDPDRWSHATPEMKEHFQAFGGTIRTCLGQNVARMELLHATALFFRELPNARLADSTTAESMDIIDFFVIKPKGGKCEITTKDV
ncbi:hypothetical protein M409DRAFT_23262 [Zasmidium cellare ATCC 36951]|uniref:Cytochrome P450 n=1 Tax=Zasmidium cellare ATCC 36951 TaxID=1080233 RepID=A0A6A6CLN2_ZASCE|nr:uncharacterized protein M409DRAFT_23262 [Zasmidium cellare ATCC 36951]KAF2166629.1 hypothetical protein M409DRAFT_23262 [Zasmidium cellare ATCC 36951]